MDVAGGPPEPTAGRASVRDLAAVLGLSPATISRALNGHAYVSDETRRRVLDAVEQLGSEAPRSRRAPRLGAVLVRCPYELTDYFGPIVSAVAETLHLHGREVLLDAGGSSYHEPVLRRLPPRADVVGAVLLLPPESVEDLEWLRRSGKPFVVVDPRVRVPKSVMSVSAANFAGSRDATAHLIAHGHRRIGVISVAPALAAGDARLAGHATALAEVGEIGDPELVRRGEPVQETGEKYGGELLDLPERPTAIVCFNDKVAVGVLQAAADRGLSVPGDLSVVGFDDIDVSRSTTPRLTTVRQPLQELGRMAAGSLVRVLDGHRAEALHIELATELVVRGSTGPVSESAARP
ncbi:LacI family DNA-binding transcriptional regulator [Cellulomonas sp. URHD0024]|uniref:LacI family DNA-binding transcriptional regulator n=1 Tax=Cellulomonas sp. URHD0024 TaxID=1302620 RepID=UPI0003FEEEA7|nr:LacI family DNA-binding transcriptional regulator [Cellulomonas sp. URHD0024]